MGVQWCNLWQCSVEMIGFWPMYDLSSDITFFLLSQISIAARLSLPYGVAVQASTNIP